VITRGQHVLFCKKEPKNFCPLSSTAASRTQNIEKFFASFLQKRSAFLSYISTRA
jgi:hypothetical protein